MPSGAAEHIRTRVVYHGRVQGVGFRYTALEVARRFAVAGFVRNRRDGTVELEAQGAPEQVEAFLAALAEQMRGNVRSVDRVALPPRAADAAERDFEIRF